MLFSAGIVILGAVAILLVSHAFKPLFARFRQPSVVAELCVGIVLGLLLNHGIFAKTEALAIFKHGLYWISEPALLIYMYCLGYETDARAARATIHGSVLLATCAFLVPFGVTYLLLQDHLALLVGRPSTLGLLAICGATSATAFPVLSRVLRDTGLLATNLGTIVLSAAAIDDLFSWILLGALTVIVRHTTAPLDPRHFGAVALCVLALFGCRFVLRRPVSQSAMFAGSLAIGVLAITAAVLGGIDPILGAFATGLLTPRSTYVQAAASYLRRLSTAALPLFFALSGMSVEIPALTGALPAVAFWTLLCTVTKVGASFLAATATRLGPRESLTAGALMNCRGVVGIIFLTLAERNGLIEASAYSVLLLVFLICTVICTPIVEWLGVAASLRAPRTPLANTALADS